MISFSLESHLEIFQQKSSFFVRMRGGEGGLREIKRTAIFFVEWGTRMLYIFH